MLRELIATEAWLQPTLEHRCSHDVSRVKWSSSTERVPSPLDIGSNKEAKNNAARKPYLFDHED